MLNAGVHSSGLIGLNTYESSCSDNLRCSSLSEESDRGGGEGNNPFIDTSGMPLTKTILLFMVSFECIIIHCLRDCSFPSLGSSHALLFLSLDIAFSRSSSFTLTFSHSVA